VLVQHTTPTKSEAPQSGFASSFRRSLRNFTSVQFTRKVFQRKRTVSDDSLARDSTEDWVDDFHLITLEDLESESPPLIVHTTISASARTPHPTLPPLLIPDSKITRLSTHTPNSSSLQKTITTGSSPTPTLTEVAHITSSFPQPPTHLPIAIPSSSTRAFFSYKNHSKVD
jgi:hypothetical protein